MEPWTFYFFAVQQEASLTNTVYAHSTHQQTATANCLKYTSHKHFANVIF